MIRFPCPNCSKGLKAPDDNVGTRCKCPRCNVPVVVPGTDAKAGSLPIVEFDEPEASIRPPVLAQALGLHPAVGIFVVVLDFMLFGADATVLFWFFVTVPVSLLLTIPCTLVQRFAYGDHWAVAVAKGMMVGILTVIPTPLPSILTATAGGVGVLGVIKGCGKKPPRRITAA